MNTFRYLFSFPLKKKKCLDAFDDYLYWDFGAMLYYVIRARIWLGLVRAMVRKTWCPAVCQLAGLLPLSSQTRAENRHKEEYGHISHGKDKMQILQIYFWLFFKISIWFSSIFMWSPLALGPAGLPCCVLVIYSEGWCSQQSPTLPSAGCIWPGLSPAIFLIISYSLLNS